MSTGDAVAARGQYISWQPFQSRTFSQDNPYLCWVHLQAQIIVEQIHFSACTFPSVSGLEIELKNGLCTQTILLKGLITFIFYVHSIKQSIIHNGITHTAQEVP